MPRSEGEQRITIDGEEIILIRSARRKRTVTADRQAGVLRLRVPLHLRNAQVEEHVRAFQKRFRAREASVPRTDEELMQRARELSARYLDGHAQPTSVRWVTNQRTRWGSTTPEAGTIRLSDRLRAMPAWVQDSVLVHELAHLIEPGHGPRFQELTSRYPETKEAEAFLAGATFAWSHPEP